jgi:hypothetical protein
MCADQPATTVEARALDIARRAHAVAPCPMHPDVLVALKSFDELSLSEPDEIVAATERLLAQTPAYCPLCADVDD